MSPRSGGPHSPLYSASNQGGELHRIQEELNMYKKKLASWEDGYSQAKSVSHPSIIFVNHIDVKELVIFLNGLLTHIHTLFLIACNFISLIIVKGLFMISISVNRHVMLGKKRQRSPPGKPKLLRRRSSKFLGNEMRLVTEVSMFIDTFYD